MIESLFGLTQNSMRVIIDIIGGKDLLKIHPLADLIV
jgi:hypothetical protein